MARIETQYVLVGRDRTQGAFRSLNGNVGKAERGIRALQGALAAVGTQRAIRSIVDAGLAVQRFERGLQVATGSAEGAAREFQFVRDVADELGLNLEKTAESYTKLAAAARGTSLEGNATREIFIGISQASRALGLSADRTRSALTAVDQIISKGRVSAEELRQQLGESLPGAFQIAARAIGVTTEELDKLLASGSLASDDFIPRFGRQLQQEFAEAARNASNDAAAAFERLSTAIFELRVAVAESGVLDALASLSDGIRETIGVAQDLGRIFAGDLGFGAQANVIEQQIASIRNELEGLEGIESLAGGLPDALQQRYDELSVQLESLKRQQLEVLTQPLASSGINDLKLEFIDVEAAVGRAKDRLSEFNAELRSDAAEKFDKQLEAFSRRFQTAEQRADDLRNKLNLFYDDLTEGQRRLVESEIDDILFGDFENIDIDIEKRFTEPAKRAFDGLESLAQSTSRVMSGFFAQSFFDPTKRGLDGLVQSFGQAFAQIIAEAVSSKFLAFFQGIFGGGGDGLQLIDLNSLPQQRGIQGFASGGTLRPGQLGIVGEEGPELIRNGRSPSTIIPNGQIGGRTEVNIIGAPAGTEVRERQEGGVNITDVIIGTVVGDLANNGELSQAMQGNFGLTPSFRS